MTGSIHGKMMTEVELFLIIIVGLFIVAALAFFITRRSGKQDDDAATDYAAGLSYLVSGEKERALDKLRQAVRKDTTNIDAYLKIGDILRDMGQVDQAIKVHKSLTARTSLRPSQRLQILRSLVDDYEARKNFKLALETVQQLLQIKKDDLQAREKELEIYEALGDWSKAASVYKTVAKLKGSEDKSRLALYRVEMGKQHVAAGNEKEARTAFREAIKIYPQCTEAHLELCESYIRSERNNDALETIKKFVQAAPNAASKALHRIKDMLFEIGEFGEIGNIYNQVISKSPENWQAFLALAELHEKKGEIDQAIEVCQRVLQRNPDYVPAREHLVRYYHRDGQDILAVEQALAMINSKKAQE